MFLWEARTFTLSNHGFDPCFLVVVLTSTLQPVLFSPTSFVCPNFPPPGVSRSLLVRQLLCFVLYVGIDLNVDQGSLDTWIYPWQQLMTGGTGDSCCRIYCWGRLFLLFVGQP